MSLRLKLFILVLCLSLGTAFPGETKLVSPFKDKTIDFFPVPVVESRPDEGESYGVMPVVLFSDKDTQAISIILAAIGQYNEVTKFGGAAILYYYPEPNDNSDEVVEINFEMAQDFYRELNIGYFNPRFLEKFYLDTKFTWLKTPFRRFYGYGAGTTSAAETNYVSDNVTFNTTFGYYFTKDFRVNFGERFTTTNLGARAITSEADTITTYGALPGVINATELFHTVSATYDTRPQGTYSKAGTFLQASYFLSIDGFLSDNTINGFNLEAIKLFPWLHDRTVTVVRGFLQDMYGSAIPFYEQSTLGGDAELRSFIPNRFTDTGKFVLTIEQRIRLISKKIFGIPVEFYTDPFVELGRVFHHLNHMSAKNLQPVAGIGLRAFVPPNVMGRLDFAIGTEGYSVYTMLGYPF